MKRILVSLAICSILLPGTVASAAETNVNMNDTQIMSVQTASADQIAYEEEIETASNIEDINLTEVEENATINVSETQPGFTNYIITGKNPQKTVFYKSGVQEKTYSVIGIAVRNSNTSSGVDETMDNGDIALYGRIELIKIYQADDTGQFYDYSKLVAIESKAYNFRETGVHDLLGYPMCWGEQANSDALVVDAGVEDFSSPKLNIPHPSEGTVYRNSNLGFQYYYRTSYWGVTKCDFMVSYKHGNSEYMVTLTVQYGTSPDMEV